MRQHSRVKNCRRLLGEAATLTNNPSAIPFGGSTPDSGLLAHGESMLQASGFDGTPRANTLCRFGPGFILRVEHGRVKTATCSKIPPLHFLLDFLYRQDRSAPQKTLTVCRAESPNSTPGRI